MNETVEAKVRQTVADVMNVPLSKVAATTGPSEVEGWDSVQHLNLVLALEQAFGISFAPEEIEKMQRVDAITAIIQSRM